MASLYHQLDDETEFDAELPSASRDRFWISLWQNTEIRPPFKSEPGRYCVAEGSVILGRVHAVKQNAGKKYVGTDVGMNVLVRPSMLYDSWHDIEVIRNGQVVPRTDMEEQTVTGNICESGDLLAKDRMLPQIRRG